MDTWHWDCFNSCGPTNFTAVPFQYASCFQSCVVLSGWKEQDATSFELPVWAALLSSFFLVMLSGLFSGLTLGLLSLDLVGLRILQKGGESDERLYASQIIPVREHGNLLLCTLLLGNTATNSAISILLSGITSGVIGLLVSTFVILILGEIMPQAVCSRHSLYLGAKVIVVVKLFMLLFLPITWPLAFVLDKLLGRDIGTVYSQEELQRLIDIHVEDPVAQAESGLTITDHRLLTGVLNYKDKIVRDVMTKIGDAFLLEKSMRLNFQTLSRVYISGCSRIPVFEGERDNIVGILFVKDLILVDPDDEIEVSTVMAFRARNVSRVYDSVTLDKVFLKFMASSNHMLIAHLPPPDLELSQMTPITQTRVTGLITLEDVLEEMINSEIYDESDENERASRQRDKSSATAQRDDVSLYLNLFDPKLRGNRLSPQETQAVFAFLTHNVEEFRGLISSEVAFKGLIRTAEVIERGSSHHAGGGNTPTSATGSQAVGLPTFADLEEEHGQRFWNHAAQAGAMLYERGRPSLYFTLILQGKVLIRTGSEAFELDLGPWSHLGDKALVLDMYLPDFDAVAIVPYRILRIHRGAYRAALDACRLDAAREFQAVKQQMRLQTSDASASSAAQQAAQYLYPPAPPMPPNAYMHMAQHVYNPQGYAATMGQPAAAPAVPDQPERGSLAGHHRRALGLLPLQSSELELATLDQPPSPRGDNSSATLQPSEEDPLLSPSSAARSRALSEDDGPQGGRGSGGGDHATASSAMLISAADSLVSHGSNGVAPPAPSRFQEYAMAVGEASYNSCGSGGGDLLLPAGSSLRRRSCDSDGSGEHRVTSPPPTLNSPHSGQPKISKANSTLMQLFTSDLPFLPSMRSSGHAGGERGQRDHSGGGGGGGPAGSHRSSASSDSGKEWPEWEAVDATTFGPPSHMAHSPPHSTPPSVSRSLSAPRGGGSATAAEPEGVSRPRAIPSHTQSLRVQDPAAYHGFDQPRHGAQYPWDSGASSFSPAEHQHQQQHQPVDIRRGSSRATSAEALDVPPSSLSFTTLSAVADSTHVGRDDVLHSWRRASHTHDGERGAEPVASPRSAAAAVPHLGERGALHTIVTVLPPVSSLDSPGTARRASMSSSSPPARRPRTSADTAGVKAQEAQGQAEAEGVLKAGPVVVAHIF